MPSTEELLQELIALQKEEMRRTKNYRTTRLILGTLPTIIFLILTVWGSVALYQVVEEAMQSMPELMQGQGLSNFTQQF